MYRSYSEIGSPHTLIYITPALLIYKLDFQQFDNISMIERFIYSQCYIRCCDIMEEIVQYIIVNMDLKMQKGKLAAQVAHGAMKGYMHIRSMGHSEIGKMWLAGSHTKIILKACLVEIEMLMEDEKTSWMFTPVIDEGRTQIEKGSLTVLASIPHYKNEFPEKLKTLKLL